MKLTRLIIASLLAFGTNVSIIGAVARRSSVATTSTAGPAESSFCAVDGKITVVHSCRNQDVPNYSTCSIGQTLLTGPATLRLGPGNHSVPSGCYAHKLANTTVTGVATAVSTVWYNSKD
jgi:hypothetical protein